MKDKKNSGTFFLVKAKKGSRCRYNFSSRILKVEDILPEEVCYPNNYGILTKTARENNEPMDGFLLMDEPLEPGSFVKSRPVAMVRTTEEGMNMDRAIMVPCDDPEKDDIMDLDDINEKIVDGIKSFLEKMCRNKNRELDIKDVVDKDTTQRLINRSKKIYKGRNK